MSIPPSPLDRLFSRKGSVVGLVSLVLSFMGGGDPVLAQTPTNVPIVLNETVQQQCLEVLRAGMSSEEFWPAMHAAEALTLWGETAAVRAEMERRRPTETDAQRRCGLARESVRAGDRTQLAVLFEILTAPDAYGHTHASESLYKIAEVGDGVQLRKRMVEAKTETVQLMAAAALARGGDAKALERIRSRVTASEPLTRRIAAWILGILGSQADVQPLRKQAEQETEPISQAYFSNALACLGESQGKAELLRNLESEDASIRTYSAEFAGYAKLTEAQPLLTRLLEDPQLDVRVRAAQSLGMLSRERRPEHEWITNDVYRATPQFPRYSEGSVITLTDGSLLFATTQFVGGGADHATAQIVSRTSRDGGRTWEPIRVLQENTGRQNVMSVTLRRLQYDRQEGPIGLFYLVKNGPNDLRIQLRVSQDELQTLGPPINVGDRAGYHVMNNDRVTVLASGRLLCPVAWTADVQRQNHFVCFCYYSDDQGKSWKVSENTVDAPKRGAMEPEVVELRNGELLMIVRTQIGQITTARSADGGASWGAAEPLSVRSPEAPATIRRIPATGDLLLIWNNHYQAGQGHGGRRWPLTAAISSDEGRTWTQVRNLDAQKGEAYAYTSVLFVRDRAVLTYYVADESSGRISSRFRSLPIPWFYSSPSEETP
jgi:sialidase-1